MHTHFHFLLYIYTMQRKSIFTLLTPITLSVSVLCSIYLVVSYLHGGEEIGVSWIFDPEWFKENMYQVKEWSAIQWFADIILTFIQQIFQ